VPGGTRPGAGRHASDHEPHGALGRQFPLVAGTTDPEVLAEPAKGKLRAKIPALREALVGRFDRSWICSSRKSRWAGIAETISAC
jgi:hypothetical protein